MVDECELRVLSVFMSHNTTGRGGAREGDGMEPMTARRGQTGSSCGAPGGRNRGRHGLRVRRSATGAPSRTSPEGDGAPDAEAWEQAARWVEEHRKLIVRCAERYAGYAPYDRQDYLQQAVLAAFHAWKDCVRAGQPERFTAYCFIRFRRECRDELAIRRDAPGSLRPEDRLLDPPAGGPEANRRNAGTEELAHREALLRKALHWMTPRQQLAWLLALGHLGHGQADPKEIARTLKISRRAAAGLLARGQAQAEEGARREKQGLEAAG